MRRRRRPSGKKWRICSTISLVVCTTAGSITPLADHCTALRMLVIPTDKVINLGISTRMDSQENEGVQREGGFKSKTRAIART